MCVHLNLIFTWLEYEINAWNHWFFFKSIWIKKMHLCTVQANSYKTTWFSKSVSPKKRWVPQTKKLQIIVSYDKNSLILTSFTFHETSSSSEKQAFWHFCWLSYLYTFSLYENASFIIVSADTEYISTRSWYRNINFLRANKANLCIAWSSSLFLRWRWRLYCFDNYFTYFVPVLL
jgi:hypothetical protein